jgi:hypothetical protein
MRRRRRRRKSEGESPVLEIVLSKRRSIARHERMNNKNSFEGESESSHPRFFTPHK